MKKSSLDKPIFNQVENTHIIDCLKVKKLTSGNVVLTVRHTIALVLEGEIVISMMENKEARLEKEKMAFFPAGMIFNFYVAKDATVILIRLSDIKDWKCYCPVECAHSENRVVINGFRHIVKHPPVLCISEKLTLFLRLLRDYLEKGLRLDSLMELKVKEFLILMSLCYTQKELNTFYKDVAGKEMSFVEYVQENWNKYNTINDFAASMKLSTRQFSARFGQAFNMTPYQWVIENKARMLYYELVQTDKPFKQISIENNFKTLPHFNTFCKLHLGKTPSEVRSTPCMG